MASGITADYLKSFAVELNCKCVHGISVKDSCSECIKIYGEGD